MQGRPTDRSTLSADGLIGLSAGGVTRTEGNRRRLMKASHRGRLLTFVGSTAMIYFFLGALLTSFKRSSATRSGPPLMGEHGISMREHGNGGRCT